MSDTTTASYTIRISAATPDDEGNDDGMKWVATIEPEGGDPFPLAGYGETAVEAAADVVAAYIEDPS